MNEPFILLMVTTLIALAISSFVDIKKREVPDWISYGLLVSAFGMRAIISVDSGWEIFLNGIFGFLLFFLLGSFFYYTNQWGGGDSKLLMAMGAVIGIAYPFNAESFSLVFFFLLLLLSGAVWGIAWMVYQAFHNYETFKKKWKEMLQEHKSMQWIFLSFSMVFLLSIFLIPFFAYIFFLPLLTFYLILFVNTVEKSCFYHFLPIDKLTPGDWLGKDIIVKRRMFMKRRTLDEKDITALKALQKKGVISSVLIKEGVPFIPSFFISYALLLLSQDAISQFLIGL